MRNNAGKFTVGERRGMIALLIVVVIALIAVYMCNNTTAIYNQITIDSATQVAVATENGGDTIKPKKKRKKKANKPETKPTPPRDILDEEVPQITE